MPRKSLARFKDLQVGQTFDFIDENNVAINSFYDRCVKTSTRRYRSLRTGQNYVVGTIYVTVYNVSEEVHLQLR